MNDFTFGLDAHTGKTSTIVDINENPCRGCVSTPICATGMACKQYRVWVHTGVINPALPRRPTCKAGF